MAALHHVCMFRSCVRVLTCAGESFLRVYVCGNLCLDASVCVFVCLRAGFYVHVWMILDVTVCKRIVFVDLYRHTCTHIYLHALSPSPAH